MKKFSKTRRIIAATVAVLIVLSGTFGFLFLNRKPAPTVNDRTAAGAAAVAEYKRSNTDKNSVQAVLSNNCLQITGDDADKVNSSIKNIELTSSGLYVTVKSGTALDNTGVGDVFFLDGSESTPIGEPYFGKVANISDNGSDRLYVFETPMVDEVFDLLDFNLEKTLTPDSINDIKTVDGVTVTKVDDLMSHFSSDAKVAENNETAMLCGTDIPSAEPISKEKLEIAEGLLLNVELDLFEVFGLKEDDDADYNSVEDNMTTVYATYTGKCYHSETCVHLRQSKIQMTLGEAKGKNLRPCKVCHPPVSSPSEFEPTAKVTGKVGLENISVFVDYDWDIINGGGINELSVNTDGKFVFEVGLESNAEFEISGKETKLNFSTDFLKVTGLKEKLLPIAFIGYNGAVVTNVGGGNQAIRALTAVPVTVGMVFYIDIDGNITVGSSVTFTYNYDFNTSLDVVRDGKFVWDNKQNDGESDRQFKLAVEAKGDVDACIGGSIGLYVFNLNPFEFSPLKVGAEAEGSLELAVTVDKDNVIDDTLSADFYARLYAKLFEFKVNLKLKAKLFTDALSADLKFDYTRVLSDRTIAEWGTKNPTRYDSTSMSYSNITAKDKDALYYKNEQGNLVREVGGQRTDLYTKKFFIICGIDETYIYLLCENENSCYDIVRVNKYDGNNKKLIENVAASLYFDEDSIYYTSDFSPKTLSKYNRMHEKDNDIATFGEEISMVRPDETGLYVVTIEDSTLAFFFGISAKAYHIKSDGSEFVSYGSGLDVSKYCIEKKKKYKTATNYSSGGYLRNYAAEVVWLGADASRNVVVEGTSGWNSTEDGIFVKKDDFGNTPSYKIVLYKAQDGSCADVVPVYHNKAFFTLCKGDNGYWYYIDQNDEGLILCTVSGDFSQHAVLQKIDLGGRSVDLDECGTVIVDNQIFFYIMPDDNTTEVLYRYNVAN